MIYVLFNFASAGWFRSTSLPPRYFFSPTLASLTDPTDQLMWILVGLQLLATLLLIGTVIYARRLSDAPVGRPFCWLMGLSAVWVVMYSLQMVVDSISLKILFSKIQHGSNVFLTLMVVWIVFEYLDLHYWLARRRFGWLFLLHLTFVGFIATSHYHTLWRYDYQLDPTSLLPVMQYRTGIGQKLYTLVITLEVFGSLGLLIFSFSSRKAYVRETLLISLGIIIPFFANILFVLGFSPISDYNFAPLAFVFTSGMYLWAFHRLNLFDLTPVARNLIMDALDEVIIVLNQQHRLIDFNRAAQLVCGLSFQESIGLHAGQLPGEWGPIFDRLIDSSTTRHEVVIGEGTSRRHYELTILPINDHRQQQRGWVFLFHDITARKQAEEALRASEARYRRLFQDTPIALWEEDFSATKNYLDRLKTTGITDFDQYFEDHPAEIAHCMNLMRVVDVNQAALQLYGVTDKQTLVDNLFQTFDPQSTQPVVAALSALAAGKLTFETELVSYKLTGEPMALLLRSFTSLDDQTGFARLVVAMLDLTDRKRAEELLMQAKETADAANQAKSTFLASMSHELRSPLNAILGFAQIMHRNPHLTPENLEHIGIILQSGKHLLTLINQVLDLSKIEAGYLTLNPQDVNLYQLLDELRDIFILKATNKGLQLYVEREANIPAYIRTDEIKLRQVLINLLNNALKFTEVGGVTVNVELVEPTTDFVSGSRQICHLKFEISDTGPGIAPEEMATLFQPFSQTETGRQVQEGTGLGLSISQNFVQLMGGLIEARSPAVNQSSNLGPGTTFFFTIQAEIIAPPLVSYHRPTTMEQPIIALEPGQPSYRLLIVDDKLDNRQLLIKLLAPLGVEWQEATNGAEAVERWQTFQPHLIWMDIRMPVMDGYEATRQIRNGEKQSSTAIPTKIIGITAGVYAEERETVLQAGCDDFLQKPFRQADFFQLMGQHLGVRFVYNEPVNRVGQPDDLPQLKSRLQQLPAEWLKELHQAAGLLDFERLMLLTDQIAETEPEVANLLVEMINQFAFDEIIELISHHD